jgi:hypothetical protein
VNLSNDSLFLTKRKRVLNRNRIIIIFSSSLITGKMTFAEIRNPHMNIREIRIRYKLNLSRSVYFMATFVLTK